MFARRMIGGLRKPKVTRSLSTRPPLAGLPGQARSAKLPGAALHGQPASHQQPESHVFFDNRVAPESAKLPGGTSCHDFSPHFSNSRMLFSPVRRSYFSARRFSAWRL